MPILVAAARRPWVGIAWPVGIPNTGPAAAAHDALRTRHYERVMSRLRLVPRDRDVEDVEWGVMARRRFLDFEVDGRSFYDMLRERGMDYISVLWLDSADESPSASAVAQLLGDAPGDLPDGRVAVFVCPECGDLGCGAITVRLVIAPGEVAWHEWGWQSDYDSAVDRSQLADLPSVTLHRAEYERTLRDWRAAARKCR